MKNYDPFDDESPWNGLEYTTVVIGDGVTSIGDWAFYECRSMTAVTIPDSVTNIGFSVFCNCDALTSVTIPEGVTSIAAYAFEFCDALTSVTIPDSVTYIGGLAFEGTPWLTEKLEENPLWVYKNSLIAVDESLEGECIIPDGVTSIGNYAFNGCTSLTSVTIPEGVTSIAAYAFEYCEALTSVAIPEGVTSIDMCAFQHCDALTSVTIPNSMTSIETYLFYHCNSLTSVTIPASVTSIGFFAFSNCESLTSVTIENPNCQIYDKNDTISNGEDENGDPYFNGTIYGYTDSTAQAYAETYGYAFESLGEAPADGTCGENLTWRFSESTGTLTISGTGEMTDFEKYKCPWVDLGWKITAVVIGDGVTSIGDWAFYECGSMTAVTIPDSVMSIGNDVFNGCTSLTSVTIPESVTSIHAFAFYFCDALTSVVIENPDCEIFDDIDVITNGLDENGDPYFNGTIYGYIDSTAQTYAEKYGYTFKSLDERPDLSDTEYTTGDVDGDGGISTSDAAAILVEIASIGAGAKPTFTDAQNTAANLNGGDLDTGDAALILQYIAVVGAGENITIDDYIKS